MDKVYCPECGKQIEGYEDGDTCLQCWEIEGAADFVIDHIDKMYPIMWEGTPSSARMSLKNTIRSQIKGLFR